MCEPATLSAIGMGLGLGSTALNLKANADQTRYQQKVAKANTDLANASAAQAIQRGNDAASVRQMEASQQIGQERVQAGAGGVDGSVGTAANVQAATRAVAAIDSKTLQANAALEAWGYKVDAARATAEGKVAELSGKYKAAGTLLGGAGDALSSGLRIGRG
jgi:hypothetical protein